MALVLDEKPLAAAVPPAAPPMGPHSVLLNTLNASALNSKYMLSLTAKFLYKAMLKFQYPGLRKEFLPALPNVNPCGAANADGLAFSGPNPESGTFGMPVVGFPNKSGYEPAPETVFPTPALSL